MRSRKPSGGWRLSLIVVASCVLRSPLFAQGPKPSGMKPVQGIPDPVDPALVVVDHSEGAYVVLIAVRRDTPEEELEELRSQVAQKEKVELVSWDEFLGERQRLLDSRILKDEYPGSKAVAGIIELLRRYARTPVGLSWNGGVAITFNDYEHAKRLYKAYLEDPEAYARTGSKDPRADPLNPRAHLGPLLGW